MSIDPSSTSTVSTTAEAGDVVARLSRTYAAAVEARDVDALVALYSDDVEITELMSREPIVGRQAWRSQVVDWFDGLEPQDRNVAEPEPFAVVPGGGDDLVVAHGRIRYAAIGPDGVEKYAMVNRFTWVSRRDADGTWRVVHEHSSVPLHPETMAPLLD